MEKLLNLHQAAEFAGVSSKTIQRLILTGRLKAASFGSSTKRPNWRIDPVDLKGIKPAATVEAEKAFTRTRRRQQVGEWRSIVKVPV